MCADGDTGVWKAMRGTEAVIDFGCCCTGVGQKKVMKEVNVLLMCC